jgi:hypothetical protein
MSIVFHRIILLLPLSLLVAGALLSCETSRWHPAEAASIESLHQVPAPPSCADMYLSISKNIDGYNVQTPIDGWRMNSEHLFVEDEELLQKVTAFSSDARCVEFLFEKIDEVGTTDDDLLRISEILVYFVEDAFRRIAGIKPATVANARKAVASGRLASVEKKYPSAPIRRYILAALNRTDGV